MANHDQSCSSWNNLIFAGGQMKQQESDRDVGADFINGDILYK